VLYHEGYARVSDVPHSMDVSQWSDQITGHWSDFKDERRWETLFSVLQDHYLARLQSGETVVSPIEMKTSVEDQTKHILAHLFLSGRAQLCNSSAQFALYGVNLLISADLKASKYRRKSDFSHMCVDM